MFLLEGLEEEEPPVDCEGGPVENMEKNIEHISSQNETLEISLHAISGDPAPKTMRLICYVGNQQVTVLIDTGSTHSFIGPNVARHAKLAMLENRSMTEMIVNRDRLPCQGCCMTVPFILQDNKFYTTLYLLTLGGCDMVLGVN